MVKYKYVHWLKEIVTETSLGQALLQALLHRAFAINPAPDLTDIATFLWGLHDVQVLRIELCTPPPLLRAPLACFITSKGPRDSTRPHHMSKDFFRKR